MKQIKCTKCNGLMHRMYMRNNKGWHISKYWMCPSCQQPYTEEITNIVPTNIVPVEVELDDFKIELDCETFERFLRRRKTPDESDIAVFNRILDGDVKVQPR